MSKKAERVKRSFAKQWFGVISGSMFVLSTQAAHAGHHGGFDGPNARVDHVRGERHALRQQIRNQSMQNLNGENFRLNNGINLDLAATNANITLGANLFRQVDSVTISRGGENKTFNAGSQVTSAEYVAIKQVLGGHEQSITVDGAGRATGGQFDLNSISASNNNNVVRASSLVIPQNVTADGQFGRGSEFRLVGNLDNFGSIVASSNNRNGSTLHADDINNHSGASIASVKNDLHLIADGSLINDGSISSAASLSMTGGSGVTNRGNVQATNNVSINASSIANSGTITATNGNINIDGPATAILTIDNTGGVMSATNGAVNLRSADYAGAFDTNMNGGDVLSKTLDIYSGNGLANINVNELTGEINHSGLGAHVQAATDVLTIGETCLTGDPTYYNTAGSINIAGNISVAEALTIIASGDITSANNISITAANAAGGFPINLIAGANIVFINGGANQTTVGPIPPANANNGDVGTINGNVFGGSIFLGTGVTISTRGSNTPSNGADVIMNAFAGAANGSGRILISGTTINTGGRGTGTNGNVTLIAGITGNTDAINVGTIDTTGGTGAGGSIGIHAVQPVVSPGASGVGFFSNGSNTGVGTYVPGVNAGQTGNIRVTGPLSGSSVILNAGNSVFVDNNITSKSGMIAFGHSNFTQSGTSQIIATDTVNGIVAINTDGNITGNTATLMQAPNMLLISNNGKIGVSSGLRLRVDADTLSMTALNGSAFVNDTDAVNLNTSNVGGTLEVIASDNLTTTGASTGDIVKLTGDQIAINKNVSGGTSLTVIAGSDIIGGGGVLSANNVFLTATSADLGSSANPVLTNADNLVASAPFGGVVIQEQDSVNLGGGVSNAKNGFSVTAGGALNSTSLVSAANVVLQGGSFGLTGQIVGGTKVTLFSQSDFNNGNVTGSVSAPTLVLQSNGDIGTSVVPFKVNGASNLQASIVSASSNNQSVFVQGASGVVFGPSSAKSTLSLSSLGSLTLAGNLTANTNATGTISVNAASGTLKINDGVQILSTDDINIVNSGTNKTNDKLIIGNSVQIVTNANTAGDGNINLILGTNSGKPKTKIKNITVVNQGGSVQFLNKGLTAAASTPPTTFTAIKANIVTGNSVNTKNFTIGKSVIVTADPPAPAGTPIIIIDGNHRNNEVVAPTVLSAPVSLDQTPATALQVSRDIVNAGSIDTTNLTALATLPAMLSSTVVSNNMSMDDSFMMSNAPANRNPGAKLLSHKHFATSGTGQNSDSPVVVVDEVIGETHNLNSDSAVLVATKDTTVVSPLGKVKLAAGAIAFISTEGGQLSVFDFEDKHKDSVVVETTGKKISLSPGRHLTVTKCSAKQFADINPVEMIMHRSVNRQILDSDKTVFQSEFSLPSAIAAIKPLHTIVRSKDSEAKKIGERLMKTTAVLLQLGGSAPYSVHARTKMVAFNR